MNKILAFLGGALAGAGALAAVACVVTHLTEEGVPDVTDVAPNEPVGATPAPDTDNGAENA